MKIYSRYVLFGVIKIFSSALFILTIILLSFLVVQTSIKSGAPFSLTLKLTPYLIPEIFSMALPAAAKRAVISVGVTTKPTPATIRTKSTRS